MRDQITEGTGDILGQILKRTQGFRGRGRLTQIWLNRCQQQTQTQRVRMLPGGGRVLCDLSIPYEAMVWLEKEEQADLETLRRLLHPGERFVDCGANIGLWSLVGASAVGANGSVVAFEPNPGTRRKLACNRELSGMTNLAIQPYALSSARGIVNFACTLQHNLSQIAPQKGSDRIAPDPGGETLETSETIAVQAIALDEALDTQAPAGERRRVCGCKIDVEGHELPVLRGAERMLREDRPWLCIEFNTLLTGITRLGEWDVHRFLGERGYRAYRFEEALTASTRPALPDDWQTTGYCNLYYRVEKP